MWIENIGCQENLSGWARLARNIIGTWVESIFWEAYKIESLVYFDDEFSPEDQYYIDQRKLELPTEIWNQLSQVGIEDDSLIQKLTGSIVSLVLTGGELKFGFWSWGFIRPNVVITNAHVVRGSDTWDIGLMKAIIDGNGNSYTPKAIYFNKLCTSDVAFIVTEEASEHFIDKNDRDGIGWDIITLWIPKLVPDFQSNNNSTTLRPAIQNAAEGYFKFDRNSNGIPEFEEFERANNHIKPWHSWWLVISPSWILEGIITRWTTNPEKNTGVLYTGMQDIHREFVDFVNSMTKLWVEVK